MENSAISWTTHTFNPWRGCTKVGEGCKHCYADTLSKRNPGTLGIWGPKGTRVVAAEAQWKLPGNWNFKAAMDAGTAKKLGDSPPERPRVFCASLADVFEDWAGSMVDASGIPVKAKGPWKCCEESHAITMANARLRLFRLIFETPNLDWLLLTKRPENITRFIADGMNRAWGIPNKHSPFAQWMEDWLTNHKVPANVWIGTSVENQATADERIPHLLKVPAAVRFLSCEPLLGPVQFRNVPGFNLAGSAGQELTRNLWVIVGGESGSGARPMEESWADSIRMQCQIAGVPFFMKQLGGTKDKRHDIETFPMALRKREFPQVRA